MSTTRVYIGNLPEGVSKADIEDQFSKFGGLKDVWVARDPPGFAFVIFNRPEDAESAVDALDGKRLMGSAIKVEFSRTDESVRGGGRGGFGGRGRGYVGRGRGRDERGPPPRGRSPPMRGRSPPMRAPARSLSPRGPPRGPPRYNDYDDRDRFAPRGRDDFNDRGFPARGPPRYDDYSRNGAPRGAGYRDRDDDFDRYGGGGSRFDDRGDRYGGGLGGAGGARGGFRGPRGGYGGGGVADRYGSVDRYGGGDRFVGRRSPGPGGPPPRFGSGRGRSPPRARSPPQRWGGGGGRDRSPFR